MKEVGTLVLQDLSVESNVNSVVEANLINFIWCIRGVRTLKLPILFNSRIHLHLTSFQISLFLLSRQRRGHLGPADAQSTRFHLRWYQRWRGSRLLPQLQERCRDVERTWRGLLPVLNILAESLTVRLVECEVFLKALVESNGSVVHKLSTYWKFFATGSFLSPLNFFFNSAVKENSPFSFHFTRTF